MPRGQFKQPVNSLPTAVQISLGIVALFEKKLTIKNFSVPKTIIRFYFC
jgi:hypothetical protein